MMAAHLEKKKDPGGRGTPASWRWGLKELPGADDLFKDGGYHGLTAEDMLSSALGGWKKNNHAQYYELPTDESILTGDDKDSRELKFDGGVREPGFIQMLVCSDWSAAIDTITKEGGTKEPSDLSDTWPCGG